MIMSVSTFRSGKGAATPVSLVNFCIVSCPWNFPEAGKHIEF
jgi:hypothetical protein